MFSKVHTRVKTKTKTEQNDPNKNNVNDTLKTKLEQAQNHKNALIQIMRNQVFSSPVYTLNATAHT
jgi:hypothetical protein